MFSTFLKISKYKSQSTNKEFSYQTIYIMSNKVCHSEYNNFGVIESLFTFNDVCIAYDKEHIHIRVL